MLIHLILTATLEAIIIFYKETGTESFSNLSRVIFLISGETGIGTLASHIQSMGSTFHFPALHPLHGLMQ